jgi:hypothetical protein
MRRRFVIVLFMSITNWSCEPAAKTHHSSFKELDKILTSLKLYDKFKIEEIETDGFTLSDSTGSEDADDITKKSTRRKLTADYDLRLVSPTDEFKTKLLVSSSDSATWQVKQLIITEIKEEENKKTKTDYIWNLKDGTASSYTLSYKVDIENNGNTPF